MGNNVKIQNNVSVYTGVILEDDAFCGPSMVFTNVINPRSHVPRKHEYQKTAGGEVPALAPIDRCVWPQYRPLRLHWCRGRGDTRCAGLRTGRGQSWENFRVGLPVRRQDWGWQHPATARALRRVWDGIRRRPAGLPTAIASRLIGPRLSRRFT